MREREIESLVQVLVNTVADSRGTLVVSITSASLAVLEGQASCLSFSEGLARCLPTMLPEIRQRNCATDY
jgi:hypothetical protein